MASSKSSQIKGDIKLGNGCVICEDCKIRGDVTIGNGTIIHPRASIIAEAGPIIIGEHNLIEDKAEIIHRSDTKSGSTPVMIIGNFNVFEVGSKSEALKIGDNNVLEAKCIVGHDVVISNNCVIGAGCVFTRAEVLPENCAIYGKDCTPRITQGHQPQVLQLDHLSKVLPSYHHLVKKKKSVARDPAPTPAQQ